MFEKKMNELLVEEFAELLDIRQPDAGIVAEQQAADNGVALIIIPAVDLCCGNQYTKRKHRSTIISKAIFCQHFGFLRSKFELILVKIERILVFQVKIGQILVSKVKIFGLRSEFGEN